MGSLPALFADNLLPVFLAAGAGWLLAARVGVDPRALSHAAFLVFAPCFVFHTIVTSEVGGQALLRIGAFASISLLGLSESSHRVPLE